jgi:chemotaxis family two-component system sensor kinase Cph1
MSDSPEIGNLLRPEQPVDLTNCEREPIHIPSRIQPHGVLLTLQEPDFVILQASSNAETLLHVAACDLLGKSLNILLQPADMEALQTACLQQRLDDNPVHVLTLSMGGGAMCFDAIAHRRQGVLVLELEPAPQEAEWQDTYALVRQAIPQIQGARTLTQMFDVVAQQVRRLNGFDRVMVYQFDADGHGSVVAESKRDDMKPFLGLHYPASDIPAQARRLYTLNLLRLIGDVDYTPADIVPPLSPGTGAILDMSYCVLRDVSPIHLQYLKNLGVGASMSISILQDGALWGLIACHHDTPRFLFYDVRTACEFVGQVVSLQLATKQDAVDVGYRLRLKDVQAQLVTLMANEPKYQEGLVRHRPNLLDFIEAEGAVVCTNGVFLCLGQVPDNTFLLEFIAWLADRPDQEVFATNALSTLFPPAEAVKQVASGVLAIAVSPLQQHYLLWFRQERMQTVQWAGDPNKPVEVQQNGSHNLSPRRSFALWQETVWGKSMPWKTVELEAAQEFRRAFVTVILHKAGQLEALNIRLQRSNDELDAFTYIASHDMREPLRGIRNYVTFIQEDYGSMMEGAGQEQLETLLRLTQRMETLIDSLLLYSRIGQQELVLEAIDLNQLVDETLEALRPRLQQTQMEVRIPRPLPTIACDAVQVSSLFGNLLSNALKYNDKEQRWVEIGFLDEEAARCALETQVSSATSHPLPQLLPTVFYVSDNGIGIQEKHIDTIFRIFQRLHAREDFGGGTGAGLTIARKMAQRHGGQLWVTSVFGEGTTFYFTLQKAGEDTAPLTTDGLRHTNDFYA